MAEIVALDLCITEIVAQRSGDFQIQNFMRPSARLLIYAMWFPEAHEFDIPAIKSYELVSVIVLMRFVCDMCINSVTLSMCDIKLLMFRVI